MGNLADDTAVEGGDGRYRGRLSDDWAIWGPNGGYLAAVALRAAGAHTSVEAARPASLLCHYLGVAAFDAVDLEVTTLRAARRAESMRVSITQAGSPVLEALVWAVAEGLEGMAHDDAPAPKAPPPDQLRPTEELVQDDAPRYRFWQNIEQRPVAWEPNWQERTAGDPRVLGWMRFRPEPCFADPFADAGRLAVLVDTFMWPAAVRGYDASLSYVAPSLDLACRFHRTVADEPWLLTEARSPMAGDGLVGGSAAVWDGRGRLAASGGQQMLCRPMRPQDRPS